MPRKRRPLNREIAHRDAKLIVIATEDSKATVKYFEEFASPNYYQNSKAQIKVIPRHDTNSAPHHVLSLLDQYKAEYQLDEDDELWLLIDVDKWGEGNLSDIATKSQQKGIFLAVSNPAIEVWLLLHVASFDEYSADEQAKLFANKRVGRQRSNKTYLEKAIRDKVGAYNKSNLNVDDFLPHVEVAIERSEQIDINPNDRWPQTFGTRVYLLAKSILNSSPYAEKSF